MKQLILQILFLLPVSAVLKAQNFYGVWYGSSPTVNTSGKVIASKGPKGDMLYLSGAEDNTITGYCYSYYCYEGRFYYFISSV